MTIELPLCPLPIDHQFLLRDPGGILSPLLGGPDQRINRIGMRLGLRLVLPEMEAEEGMAYVSDLLRGRTQRARAFIPITRFDVGSPGNPRVASNISGGSAISVTGLSGGYVMRKGQFFSVEHNGRSYLHQVTGDATSNWPIFPPLRTSLSANDPIEVARPVIEGFISPKEEMAWQIAISLKTSVAFSIVEAS